MRQTLDEVVMDDVELDDAMPEERGVWKTELGILAEDAYRAAYNAVKGTARFCGLAALHLVGGGLSASLQHRLEERLNSKKHKVYSAETATWANLVVTKPLFYGALTAYVAGNAGYSPWWGVGGALAGLIVEGGARIWWAVEISQADVVGDPLFGTLSEIAYQGCRAAGWAARQVGKNLSGAAERVRDYRNGLRERAIAEQARKDK